MAAASPALIPVLLLLSAPLAQWFLPVYVRPERAEPGAQIVGEAGARDDDRNATNTWATRALTRTCAPEGGCAGLSSAETVWTGFPPGYRPRKLIVYWRASSSGAWFGGKAEVRAFVEYSTDGKAWMTVDRFTGRDGPATMHANTAEAELSPAVDAGALKVRARLEVDMQACPNPECRRELRNPSNQSGQIWVSDIRLEVDGPRLAASRDRLRQGQRVEFRVEGAPGARMSGWKFTGAGGAVVTRDGGAGDATWSFAPPEPGTATVTVKLRGQPQLDGRPFEVSKSVEVRRR